MRTFTVRIDDEHYAALYELAQRERRSPREQAGLLLERALDAAHAAEQARMRSTAPPRGEVTA